MARPARPASLFLLLTTRAILIAYLNMKFVRLARPTRPVVQTPPQTSDGRWLDLSVGGRYCQFSNERESKKKIQVGKTISLPDGLLE